MDQWQDKAREEVKNNATRETILQPDKHHYKWQYSDNNGRHKRHHPNDQIVSMDVDPSVFTQVNRAYIKANKAYTDDDKKTHCTYSKCFNCSRQGHMVQDCPLKGNNNSHNLYTNPVILIGVLHHSQYHANTINLGNRSEHFRSHKDSDNHLNHLLEPHR